MIDEPQVVLAASVREWAHHLHRYVADHGGVRLRATILHPADALDEDHDVFVGDDCTSFLSRRFVDELQRRGRSVVGVFDPDDPTGKDELVQCGVDTLLPADAAPEEFVAAINAATPSSPSFAALDTDAISVTGDEPGPAPKEDAAARPSTSVVAVGSAGGGAGATELATALAVHAGGRGYKSVLVDADEIAPALAQRLAIDAYPNLRAAVDVMEAAPGELPAVLHRIGEGVAVLPGLSSPRNWAEQRPADAQDVVGQLTTLVDRVVVNVGSCIEDLHAAGGPARYGLSRKLLADADSHVVVANPTPTGLTRLFEWLADLRVLNRDALAHVVFNRAVGDAYRRGQLVDELARTVVPAGVWFVPYDARVIEATWTGDLVAEGPFTKAVAQMGEQVLGLSPRPSRVRRGWRR